MLKISWRPEYVLSLPDKHRFPMEKYDLLPQQLLYENCITEENIFTPQKASIEQANFCHTPEYTNKLLSLSLSKSEIRRTGFPLSKELIEREFLIVGGTIECTNFAFKHGISMNIAGGTHHAFSEHGEGFCLLNDQAIASQHLLRKGLASKILIIDLDVHQGNGTAEIFQNQPEVYTFSMHGATNYPMRKEKSNLDIPLEDNTNDKTYLKILKTNLQKITRDFNPNFIFYQSGVDVLKTDKLGRLGLTLEGCKERDRIVLEFAKQRNTPIVCSMGGGYSEDIKIILEAHANTFRLAQEVFF